MTEHKQVPGRLIKKGDVIATWGGSPWKITRIEPYEGILKRDGCIGIAFGVSNTVAQVGMSIWANQVYQVVDEDL